jgi:hypothetical protein
MMDFASTQARAKEVAPPASHEGGQTEAVVAKPLSASPLLTTDTMDKMYHQLVKIHAITAMQLAECTPCVGLTPFLARFEPGLAGRDPLRCLLQQCSHHHPLQISHPRPCCAGKAEASSHKPATILTRGERACSRSMEPAPG